MKLHFKNLKDVLEYGENIGKLANKGDLIILNGLQGTGKTTLADAIGIGLGTTEVMGIPRPATIEEYQGRYIVYHVDLRSYVNHTNNNWWFFYDFINRKLQILYPGGDYIAKCINNDEVVSIIEWGEAITPILPKDNIIILDMEKGSTREERYITVSGNGTLYNKLKT